MIALVGNPNSGKTTLFNNLTGSNAHVGNWPGVTVERKEGFIKIDDIDMTVVDLPGIYSLSPYSNEEVISRDFLLYEKPDVIVNIVDASNLERNLYLTTQLVEMGIPIVVALNMMDEVEKLGDSIDIKTIESSFKIPIIPISAAKNKGIKPLLDKIKEVIVNKEKNLVGTYLEGTKAYYFINQIKDNLKSCKFDDSYFTSVKILESDEKILQNLESSSKLVYNNIINIINESEKTLNEGEDWDIVIANQRYDFIESTIESSVKRARPYGEETISDKIDKIATNKYLAIPLFLLIMAGIFFITFGSATTRIVEILDYFINNYFTNFVAQSLTKLNASYWVISLLTDGIIPGVGMVLVVLPQLVVLFLFLTILEDSGYMSRAAFVMDKFLKKFGLSGKSFIPMLMGFGCSVPAIMAARTLENERDRRMTIILTPFMSCSARWPVYAVFISALFPDHKWIVILSIYLLGILVAALSGIILKNTVLKGEGSTFIMELPPYRLPVLKNLLLNLWEKCRGFIVKAGTILLASSIVIWFLQKFSFNLQMVEDNAQSIFGQIGIFIAPLFKPLGFGDWRASVALLTGFVAKEVVVSTLGILYGVAGEVTEASRELSLVIQSNFSPLSAYSYMAFVLLYMPCIVAFATIKREMNSWKWTFFTVAFQTTMAYVVSLIIYQVGSLLGF